VNDTGDNTGSTNTDLPAEVKQPTLFAYDGLDSETSDIVRQRAGEIRGLLKRAGADIVEIGRKLVDVKGQLPHGHFGKWLTAEFSMSADTAENFMRVAAHFGDQPKLSEFAPSALYLLAAPSTPDSAREEAQERAEAGETISRTVAKQIVAEHKPTPQFEPPADEPEPETDFEPELDAEVITTEPTVRTFAPTPPPAATSSAPPTTSPARPAPPVTSKPKPQPAPTPIAPPVALTPAVSMPASFEAAKLIVTLNILADNGSDQGRRVMVLAHVDGSPAPYARLFYLSDLEPLPLPLAEALEALRAQFDPLDSGGARAEDDAVVAGTA
jgi:hypothetical protein